MTAYHSMTVDQFTQLASGLGGPATVRDLATAQLSRNLLLVKYIAGEWTGDRDARDTALSVLAQAQRKDPAIVADLLADPLVGAWTAWTTRRIRGGAVHACEPVEADFAHLGALAASAAVRTGVDAEVRTYHRADGVVLPGLGNAVLGSAGPATVTISGGRATVSNGSATVAVSDADPGWLQLRTITARHGDLIGSVTIEDGNPYRDCYHVPAAGRLHPDEVQRWQSLFAEAWHLLGRLRPERGAELATGLRSLVPLVTEDNGEARSGTARDAFGTLGLTRSRSAEDLAVTLVHEFQHSKLSGLLDLVPLYEPGGSERHFAPWRTDPRPTGGLIQGVYAFLGVADTWHAMRREPKLRERATDEFAFVRVELKVGLAALEASAELTRSGRVFAAGMRGTLDRLLTEPVPASAAKGASAALRDRRIAWEGASKIKSGGS